VTAVAAGHRLSLRSRLLALVAVLAAVLLAVAVLAGLATASLNRAFDERIDVIYPASAVIADLRSTVLDLETSERGYVLTKDEQFLAPYDAGWSDVDADVAELRSTAGDLSDIDEQLDALVDAMDRWRAEAADPEIDATRANMQFRAMSMIAEGTGQRIFDEVRGHLESLQESVNDASDANTVRSQADQRHLRDVLLAGLAGILVLLAAMAVLLTRWVTRPTDRLVASVGVVAGGDFHEAVEVSGPPEFALIGDSVDRMRQRILAEIDQLERYNEALDQTGPVLQWLRAELTPGQLVERAGVAVDGRVLAAEGLLAGDFYDLVEMPAGRFAVVIADVSGHGHQAGALALKIKYLLRAVLELGLGSTAALSWVADRLGDTGDMFATCALVIVDPSARQLEFASAGHVPGLLLADGADADPVELTSTGPLIGPFPGQWPSQLHDYAGTAVTVVLCSDGLLEARSEPEQQFGFERFVAIVREAGSVDDVVERCCAAARDYEGRRLVDDLTVVALRLDGTAPGGPPPPETSPT
jgi:sigma-B regulation protein RsbU (phosphoserine phosphatase)